MGVDRVALVTGASRGIGAATAKLLGQHGFAVVVNYLRSKDRAQEVVAAVEAAGGQAMAIAADVRDPASVDAMVRTTVDTWGSIDVLVNNAGGDLAFKAFSDITWDDFQSLLDTQVRGAFNCCVAVLPFMERKRRGAVINVISTSVLGMPPQKMMAYVTAKSALLGFSKSLATEFTAKGIQVNMISPGMTDTDLIAGLPPRLKQMVAAQNPRGRLARPEDCAKAILFFATEASDYVSGANLVISGGQVGP